MTRLRGRSSSIAASVARRNSLWSSSRPPATPKSQHTRFSDFGPEKSAMLATLYATRDRMNRAEVPVARKVAAIAARRSKDRHALCTAQRRCDPQDDTSSSGASNSLLRMLTPTAKPHTLTTPVKCCNCEAPGSVKLLTNTTASDITFRWFCSVCGHEWPATSFAKRTAPWRIAG